LEKKLNNMTEDTTARDATLSSWTWDQIKEKCAAGEKLIVIRGYVVDCLKPITIGGSLTHSDASVVWYRTHPGGKKMLDAFVGKDATTAFEGEVYAHSSAAGNVMERIRVARVAGYEEKLETMSRWGGGTESYDNGER
jgi:stearoyl-CoA desaturase (delta-9 desaturase)